MVKRKLVRQGKSTLTLSLPIEWIKKNNLTDGNEVDVVEVGNSLEVNTKRKLDTKKIAINIKGMKDGLVWRTFMGLYRAGADEIIVTHKNQLSLLTKIANQFIGYAITNQSENKITITDLGGLREVEFESIFRRLYFLVLDAFAVCGTILEKGKSSKDLDALNITVNQFSDYCLRYLNKRGLSDPKKTSTFSQTISDLEMVVDTLVPVESWVSKMKPKERQELLEYHQEVHEIVREIYQQIFKLNQKKLQETYLQIHRLSKNLEELNSLYGFYYLQIVGLIKNVVSQIVIIHFEDFSAEN